MTRKGFVMDIEALHDQLREIAATSSIDARADRGQIDRRAGLYRQQRRRVAYGVVILGVAGLLVALLMVTSGGDEGRSVRVPPAQQSNGATPQPTPLAKCLAQQAELGRLSNWPAGTVSMIDEGTHMTASIPVETYCEEAAPLETQFFADHPSVSVSVYLEDGVIKVRSGTPVVTNPTSPPETTTTSVSGSAPPCTASQLVVKFESTQGATQSTAGTFWVWNTGTTTCTWHGGLSIDFLGSDGSVEQTASPTTERSATLTPRTSEPAFPETAAGYRDVASFLITWQERDVPNGGGSCPHPPLVPARIRFTFDGSATSEIPAAPADTVGDAHISACVGFGVLEFGTSG
jgi:hypothetical protein